MIEEGRLQTTEQALRRRFAGMDPARIVLEVGTHSGIATPSDSEAAIETGCRNLKFFPAQPSGGMKYLKSIAVQSRRKSSS